MRSKIYKTFHYTSISLEGDSEKVGCVLVENFGEAENEIEPSEPRSALDENLIL